MRTNFAIFVMARSIIDGHATPLPSGCAIPFGRHEHAPDTGLHGARHSVPSLQLLARSTGLPAVDSFRASTIQGGAASVAGTKEVAGKIGRLLSAVTLAAFLSSGSSDCLIGGSAVSAAGGLGAVRGNTLAILSGDHDRFGLESTATGHDVALDVDNAIHAYLTGKPTKNHSLLHEGGNGSRGETFGSVAADQAESAEKGHQVKQVSRKLQAGGLLGRGEVRTLKVKQVSRKLQAGVLLGRGEACADHTECAVGKCKGHRGQDMECRVKLADCKRYGTHSTKRWGCPDGGACALIEDLKWGYCTAAPTGGPTSTPSTSPTDAPSASPTSSPTESPTSIPTTTPTETPITAAPTTGPTSTPSTSPTDAPSASPTFSPTESPTSDPTGAPTTPGAMIGSCDVSAESGWTYVFQLADDRTKLDMPADKASAYSNDNAAFIGNVALDTLDLKTSTVEMCAGYTGQDQCTVACTPLVDADCVGGNVNVCIKCLVGQTCGGTWWQAADTSRNLSRNDLSIPWAIQGVASRGQTIRASNLFPGSGTEWQTWGYGLSFDADSNAEFGAYGCMVAKSCTNEGVAARTEYIGLKDANVLQIRYRS